MEALEQLETQVLALLEQKAQLLAETRRLHSELEATIAAKMSLEEENRELRENLNKEEQVRGDAINRMEDYHSHNTARLDVEGMKKLLLKLRFIREDLGMEEKAKSAEIKSE